MRTTADLTTESAARFVAMRSRTVNANTVRGDLSYFSAACHYAVEEGWLDRVPMFRRVRPRPVHSATPKCHSIEEVARVLEHLRSRSESWTGGRLHALTATVAYTGLRRDEALTLMVEDMDPAAGLITVTDRRRLKTLASASPVPVPPELAAILKTWLPRCGSPWLFPGVRKKGPWTGGKYGERACDRIRQAGQEVGVAGFTPLSLRHTFATWARRRWGLSDLELRDVLRHISPRTQELYLHPDPDPGKAAFVASVARVSYRGDQ